MKQLLFSILLVVVFPGWLLKAQKLEKVWETSVEMKTPESVLYDETRDVIYVANINENPSQKDGNGFISLLNPDGSIKKYEWVKDLNAPKGMAIFRGMLYVSDIDQLVEIDIDKRKIMKKYEAENAVFLNDVASCKNGMIFVSDSRTAKIHMLYNGQFTVWLEGDPLDSPNGLFTRDGKLFIGDKHIYEVDIKAKEIKRIISDTGGVDGLDMIDDNLFIFSNWAGRIFIHKGGENIKIHDSTEEKINTADIDFARELNWVLVPTFFDNRVVAYKIID